MKNNIALLILSALVANASSGNPSQMTSNRSNAILHSYYPGGRVWLEQVQQKMNVDSNGVLLNGYDVVAYFTQHRAIKGTTKYHTTYKGAIYYFSSATDLATFKQNPSKYIPQYGGFCADHVSRKELVASDPTVFFIANGKLYLCSAPAGVKEFRAHERENMDKANQNWEGAWWAHENKS